MAGTNAQQPRDSRLARVFLPVWIVGLSLLVLAPTLAPGFTLSYDLVFTPRQPLNWGALGLGGGLPRAVPQDAVVALVEYVVPGMLLEKVVLLAIPLLVGFGMLRLLRDNSPAARGVAATLAIVTPYVAERLVIGHWGLLLAYAVTPWALDAARSARRGSGASALTMLLFMALGALTPSGSLLLLLLAVPVAVGPGSALSGARRWAVALAAVALLLPWVVPALLHPASVALDSRGLEVFSLRSEGWGGAVMTALGGGGIWNAQVVPASRGWFLAPLAALLLLAVAVAGWRTLPATLGRALTWWWTIVAAAGLLAAIASVWWPQAWASALSVLPGGGLLRDSHKLLAPLVLLMAAAAGLAIGGWAARVGDVALRRTLVGACLVIPLVVLPDIAWGVAGRLGVATYPDAWTQARAVLDVDPRPGDVAVLPWSAFRRFAWNADRTMLDPAPRWLTRPTIVADTLSVATSRGIVDVAGDDPRAEAVGEALARSSSDGLAALGVGWILVEKSQAAPLPPAGVPGVLAWTSDELDLYAVRGQTTPRDAPAGSLLVAWVDLLVLGLVLAVGLLRGLAKYRTIRPPV